MPCVDLSHIRKYAERDSPPANANTRGCRGKVVLGNDGRPYESFRRTDGIYTWRLYDVRSPSRVRRSPARPRRSPARPRRTVTTYTVHHLDYYTAMALLRELEDLRRGRATPAARRTGIRAAAARERAAIAQRAENFVRNMRPRNAPANPPVNERKAIRDRARDYMASIRGRP